MRYFFILYLASLFCIENIQAQRNIDINDVSMLDMPDGRRFVYEKDTVKAPLEGRVYLIDGMSGYIDAGFKDGYAVGKWNIYKKSNLIESMFYDDGYLDGEYIELSAYGNIRTLGYYRKGKKNGSWDEFYESGDKNKTCTYEDGDKILQIYYNTDGSIRSEQEFKNGDKNGVYRLYSYPDHLLKIERNFVDGTLVGKQFIWYTSNLNDYYQYSNYNEFGKLDGDFSEIYIDTKNVKTKGQYKNGRQMGKWIYGEPNGTIYQQNTYDNDGRLIESKKF
ncbi:MAG: hypothetical protein QM660_07225 [Dysgonomonas sp.]